MSQNDGKTLRETIKSGIGLIPWKQLARFFASGSAVSVAAELDLAEAAYQFSCDNRDCVEQWLRSGMVGRVSDGQAAAWFESEADVLAVVIAPWVLVQEVKPRQ